MLDSACEGVFDFGAQGAQAQLILCLIAIQEPYPSSTTSNYHLKILFDSSQAGHGRRNHRDRDIIGEEDSKHLRFS
jgi:hypothetical protein